MWKIWQELLQAEREAARLRLIRDGLPATRPYPPTSKFSMPDLQA